MSARSSSRSGRTRCARALWPELGNLSSGGVRRAFSVSRPLATAVERSNAFGARSGGCAYVQARWVGGRGDSTDPAAGGVNALFPITILLPVLLSS
eukprot:1273469-Pyramimonas_sp.AAC.1